MILRSISLIIPLLILLVILFHSEISYGDTITTPHNSAVSVFIRAELTSPEIYAETKYWEDWCDYFEYSYTLMDSASTTYNCHAYAWHVSMGGGRVWMDSPNDDIYWEDYSYIEVENESEASKVSYVNGNHSAITTGQTGIYISKWGMGPLMKHHKHNCPYDYSILRYYMRNPDHYELNDTWEKATPMVESTSYNGYIAQSGDEDWYILQTDDSDVLVVSLTNLPDDYDLHVYNRYFTNKQSSCLGGTSSEDVFIEGVDPYSIYYVQVIGFNYAKDYNTPYDLSYYLTDTYVGIGEVERFWLGGISDGSPPLSYPAIHLYYTIASAANPADSVTLYISDNPIGPARRMTECTYLPDLDNPEDPSDYNTALHRFIPPYNDEYRYYLDHGPGLFHEVRKPTDLRGNADNPVEFTQTYQTSRPVYDSPGGIMASDVFLDCGSKIEVTWNLSADDSLLDCYNIYRKDSIDSVSSSYSYLESVMPGTNSHIDSSAYSFEVKYSYKISAAHHGGTDPVQGYGYFALWNEFSEESNVCRSINNYFIMNLSLESNDTLNVCPSGDADTIKVQITILGSDSLPTEGVPADYMFLYVLRDSLYNCSSDTITYDSFRTFG